MARVTNKVVSLGIEGSANKIVTVNPIFVTKDIAMETKLMDKIVVFQMNV